MTNDSLIKTVLNSLTETKKEANENPRVDEIDSRNKYKQKIEDLEKLIKDLKEDKINLLEQIENLKQQANPANSSTEEIRTSSKYINLIITNIQKSSNNKFTKEQINIIEHVLKSFTEKTKIEQDIDKIESETLEQIRVETEKVFEQLLKWQDDAQRKEFTAKAIEMTTKKIRHIHQIHEDRKSMDKEFFDFVKLLYFSYTETDYTYDPDRHDNRLKDTIPIIRNAFDQIKSNKEGEGGEEEEGEGGEEEEEGEEEEGSEEEKEGEGEEAKSKSLTSFLQASAFAGKEVAELRTKLNDMKSNYYNDNQNNNVKKIQNFDTNLKEVKELISNLEKEPNILINSDVITDEIKDLKDSINEIEREYNKSFKEN